MKFLHILAFSLLQFGGTLGMNVTNTFSNSRPRLGETTTLNCRVVGRNASFVVWWKDKHRSRETIYMTKNCLVDKESANDFKSRLRNIQCDRKNYNFQLSDVQISDRGHWGCEADGQEATTRLILEVLVPPVYPKVTNPSPGKVGDPANFTCNAENVNVTKPVTYTWTKNGDIVATEITAPGALVFSSVTKENAGKYFCIAKNDAGSKASTEQYFIVYYAPDALQLKTTTPSNSKSEGETEIFTCEAFGGIPVPSVALIRQQGTTKKTLIQENDRVLTLTRKMMRQDNQVKFYCEATGPGISDQMTSTTITYNVFFPHNVRVKPSKTSVIEHGDVWFECITSGGNPALVTRYQWLWKKSNSAAEQVIQDTETSPQNGKFLEFVRIPYDKNGTYTCKAWNEGGVGQASTFLNVQYSPRIHPDFPMKQYVAGATGKEATVELFITANPTPRKSGYVWSRDGNILSISPEGYEITSSPTSSKLTIKSVKPSDFTSYTCTVKTSGFPAKFFKFELLEVGPPSAPSNLKVVNLTAIAATLQWISDFNGGSEQIFYVQYKKDTEGWNVASDDPPGGIIDPGQKKLVHHKVTNLESNVSYEFRVRSRNSHHGHNISNFSNIVYEKTPVLPEISLIGVSRADNRVTVHWKQLAGKYTTLVIRYCQTGTKNCKEYTIRNSTDDTATFFVSAKKTYYYYMLVKQGGDVVYKSMQIRDHLHEKTNIFVVFGCLVGAVIVAITGVAVAIVLWKRGLCGCHRPADDSKDNDEVVEFTKSRNDSVQTDANIGTEEITDEFHPERFADQNLAQRNDEGYCFPKNRSIGNESSSDNDLDAYDYVDSQDRLQQVASAQNHVSAGQANQSDQEDDTSNENVKTRWKSEGNCRENNDVSILQQEESNISSAASDSSEAVGARGQTPDNSDDRGHGRECYAHLEPVVRVMAVDNGNYLDFND